MPQTRTGDWLGHPRGTWLVAFTEMWERFSYYGLAGLLTLYLTTATSAGGWGWTTADAVRLYGWYGGLAFALPFFGAFLANNYLGERRCILFGGLLIAAGHLMLTAPALVAQPAHADGLSAAQYVFLIGLLCIVTGTGLLKPAISSIVAQFYPGDGARRNEAFAFFFVAIYIGALLGALVPGYLGERVGWHAGLGVAAVAMFIGICCYVALQKRWLGDTGLAPIRSVHATGGRLTREERHRAAVVLAQGVFTVAYAVGFYQTFGLLNVYAHNEVDRRVGSFEVPTTWLQSVSLVSFFVFVPAFAALWRRFDRSGRDPSASYKLGMGLAALALGYVVMIIGETASGAAKPHVLWLAGGYLLFGLGDALVWANQISLTSKLAPARYSAFFIGAWYLCIGIGNWLTGFTGTIAQSFSYATVLTFLAIGCAVAALFVTLLTPWMQRYMHGAESRRPDAAGIGAAQIPQAAIGRDSHAVSD